MRRGSRHVLILIDLLLKFTVFLQASETCETDEWKNLDVNAWQTWMVPIYIDAVRATAKMNRENLDSCSVRDVVDGSRKEVSETVSESSKAQGLVNELAQISPDDLGHVLGALENIVEEIRKSLAKSENRPAARIEQNSFSFPVYVMNLKNRPDKRRHMSCLLSSLGFTNVSFPNVTRGNDLDLDQAISTGRVVPDIMQTLLHENDQEIHRIGIETARAYVANALDQLEVIRQAHDAGTPLFGVFEDDLVMSSSAPSTRRAIEIALAELPPTADMLYLEACYEQCDASRFNSARPHLMRLHCPSCSAAILYTAAGARKVLERCVPVFHGIDVMFPKLIQDAQLEAYLALPQPFFQDAFWGSDALRDSHQPGAPRQSLRPSAERWLPMRGSETQHRGCTACCEGGEECEGGRGGSSGRRHMVLTPTCYEGIPWVLDDTELESVALLQGSTEEGGREVRVLEMGQAPRGQTWAVEAGRQVVYYTQTWEELAEGAGRYSVEVAVWRNKSEGVELRVPAESSCFDHSVGVCKLELVLEDADGGEEDSVHRYVILDWGQEPPQEPVASWQLF